MKTEIEIVPYGEIGASLPRRARAFGRRGGAVGARQGCVGQRSTVFLSFSHDVDKSFVELFRRKATPESRLLILDMDTPADSLLARILEMQVRDPQRLCILDTKRVAGKNGVTAFLQSVLHRLKLESEANGKNNGQDSRILDARLEKGVLRVISPRFERLEIPMARVPGLRKADAATAAAFEIDEDGAFLYWRALDLHLGWRQLLQFVNPAAALKASQKSAKFNKDYGRAVQAFREASGLRRKDVGGVSEKQLARIEKGECRLTSNAIEMLAKAHKITANGYLELLAEKLPAPGASG